jgi:long-subunit acyl-CoA synthetase (AMP-forming)
VVVFIAVTRVRAIAAPLNSAYTEDEFKFYLEDANSTLLLVPGAEGNKAAEAAATTLHLPIAGVHWEKGSSGSGEIALTPKAKLELAPESHVTNLLHFLNISPFFFCNNMVLMSLFLP